MPLAPRPPASCAKMQTKRSAWTPLNHPQANSKVFEERRSLLAKWFDRWSDSQRKVVLQDFVLNCSVEQLRFLSLSVSRQLPLQAADFTCLLPRALCLYLFSFLDPRSLCRCAQVNWRWKNIVELDQLWMPKCLRLGWCISFSPTAFEQGVWKRHYIQTVQELRLCLLQTPSFQQQLMVPDAAAVSSAHKEPQELVFSSEERPTSTPQQHGTSSTLEMRTEKQTVALPPWRDPDRCPKDTVRFNYLDNLDPIEQALRQRQIRSRASTCGSSTSKMDDGKRKTLSEATYKLCKAKSLMFLSSNCRPHHSPPPPHDHHPHQQTQTPCAPHSQDYPITKETAKSLLSLAQWNAGIRPKPVRTPVPRLSAEALRVSRRTHRSAASE
ncbi:F-box only protein 16 [Odontesthes bonariensis]